MEPEGILNGSNTNERSRNTTAITGNRPAVQSSHQGWASTRSRAWVSSPSSTWVMPWAASSLRRWAACASRAWAAARRRGRNTKRSPSQYAPVTSVASSSSNAKLP